MDTIRKVLKEVYSYLVLIISMAGFIPSHATISRVLAFAGSIVFSLYITRLHPDDTGLAMIYFLVSEVLYIGFLMLVISRKGLRLWLKKRWKSEEEGYLVYEALLGILFFHNAMSMGYLASSTGGYFLTNMNKELLLLLVAIPFIGGYLIKILAAKAVQIDIYYLKDMFLGRKIRDFVVSGPYKYFSNPMYGIGQIQAYAAAIWYGSVYGLFSALLNQCLMFTFFYFLEKKFIRRIYLNQY